MNYVKKHAQKIYTVKILFLINKKFNSIKITSATVACTIENLKR